MLDRQGTASCQSDTLIYIDSMSTTKSRLNISLPDDLKKVLLDIAKRDQMPAATKAVRLIEIGMELEEDEAWDAVAAKRDHKGSKFHSHSKLFGK